MSDTKKAPPKNNNIQLTLSQSSVQLPLATDKFLTLIAPAVAKTLYDNGDIPSEVFALVVSTLGYNVEDLFRYGQKIRPEIWRIIAPGAAYIWDEDLVPKKLVDNTSTVVTTSASPGSQPDITFPTSDTNPHSIPIFVFASDGSWVIRGTIKGHSANNTYAANFSFAVRSLSGTIAVSPINNEILNGSTTPFPDFSGVDTFISGTSVAVVVTAPSVDLTAWTIIYGVY